MSRELDDATVEAIAAEVWRFDRDTEDADTLARRIIALVPDPRPTACAWCKADGCTPDNCADCPCPHHLPDPRPTEAEADERRKDDGVGYLSLASLRDLGCFRPEEA